MEPTPSSCRGWPRPAPQPLTLRSIQINCGCAARCFPSVALLRADRSWVAKSWRSLGLAASLFVITAECGAGSGSDDDEELETLQPTLESLQVNIFSPRGNRYDSGVDCKRSSGVRAAKTEQSFLRSLFSFPPANLIHLNHSEPVLTEILTITSYPRTAPNKQFPPSGGQRRLPTQLPRGRSPSR